MLELKYFVLNPSSSDPVHREASRHALRWYAEFIRPRGKATTALDIEKWVKSIEERDDDHEEK